ncbi:MAG TPA: hypothetical protein VIL16_33585 [Trebonia sp.]
MPGLSDLEQRCVVPFYLKLMGLNAAFRDVPFDGLLNVARETTDGEVVTLLGSAVGCTTPCWTASAREPC